MEARGLARLAGRLHFMVLTARSPTFPETWTFFLLIGSRANMTQICCDELILRSRSGKVLCPDIVDFILGDEEINDIGTFREIVLSLNVATLSKIGNRIEVWNTTKDRKALSFTVTRTHSDPIHHVCKIEGRVYVRPK